MCGIFLKTNVDSSAFLVFKVANLRLVGRNQCHAILITYLCKMEFFFCLRFFDIEVVWRGLFGIVHTTTLPLYILVDWF